MTALLTGALTDPVLHPKLVHFPIALLIVAVGFDLACLTLRRHAWIDRGATTLYLLGALGAVAAFLSGRQAEETVEAAAPALEGLLEDHEAWAVRVLCVFIPAALARLWITWRARHEGEVRSLPLRASLLLLVLAGLWILFETAERGGDLVYKHGAGLIR